MRKIYLQKAKKLIARSNTIRDINKQIVLNYVRDCSPISRAEISRQTNLQRSTVSEIVDDLLAFDLVEQIGIGDSTGGRKPKMYKIKAGTPVAIGVDVSPNRTIVAVADLAGTILKKKVFPTSPDLELMTEKIIEEVSKFAKKYRNNELAVGLSVPGITDKNAGRVLYVPYFNWSDWDIGKLITEKTNLSVTIDNDANAIALAELWFGNEQIRKHRNFVTVLVAEGIGTGIVFDGQVYHGEKGAAGEFGHMVVGVNAPTQCSCGSRSCWEAHASETSLIARYQAKTKVQGDNILDVSQIFSLANDGDPAAIQSVKETAEFLSLGISNLIVGLSPQAVIISGRITKVWLLISN